MPLAEVLDVLTATAIIGGVIVGSIELRLYRRRQEREGMLELLHSFQTPEVAKAMWVIPGLEDDLDRRGVEESLGEDIDLVYLALGTFESLGVLVARGELPLALVDDVFSGPIALCWRKLRRYVREVRVEFDRGTYSEWFEWLAGELGEREREEPPSPGRLSDFSVGSSVRRRSGS